VCAGTLLVQANSEGASGWPCVKDIVTESSSFAVDGFVPLLRERLTVLNPYVRQFLVGYGPLDDVRHRIQYDDPHHHRACARHCSPRPKP